MTRNRSNLLLWIILGVFSLNNLLAMFGGVLGGLVIGALPESLRS